MKRWLVLGLLLAFFSLSVHAQAVKVDSISIDPTPVGPGQTFTLYAYITNATNTTATGVSTVLQLGKDVSDTSFPFSIEPTDSLARNVGTVPSFQTVQVKYQVRVDPSALDGSYGIRLFTNSDGISSGVLDYSIVVSASKPVLSIVRVTPTSVNAGATSTLNVTLKNTGSSSAYNILTSLSEDRTVTSTGTVVVRNIFPLGAATIDVGDLGAGQSKTFSIPILVSPSTVSNSYFVPLTLEYYDQAKTKSTSTGYAGLKIVSAPELNSVFSDAIPLASPGKKSKFTIDIFNRGLGPAKFVTAKISSTSLSLDKSEFFIGTIESDDFDSVMVDASPLSSLSPGEYSIHVDILAKNEFGDPISLQKDVAFHVYSSGEAANDGNASSQLLPLPLIVLAIVIIVGVWWFRFRKPPMSKK